MVAIDILNCDFEVGEILGISSANRFSCFEKKEYNSETLTKHTKFVYDGFKLIAEFDILNNSSMLRSYVWSKTDLDTPMWMKSGTEYYYYMLDGNKNVTKLVDEAGAIANSYEYSPFGKLTTNEETIAQPFKFSSEYADTETNLVYYNYRYYDPNSGKWTKRDPIQEQGGLNLYGFVRNSPINNIDLLGLAKTIEGWEKLKGNIYKATKKGASLETLATGLGMKKENWQCIWPTCFTGDEAKYKEARNNINKGDTFDVSNLTATSGPILHFMFPDGTWEDAPTAHFYNASFGNIKTFIKLFKAKSKLGATPLSKLVIVGHSTAGANVMWGDANSSSFNIGVLEAMSKVKEGQQNYEHAKKKIGPPRCWFTKNAKFYGAGCETGIDPLNSPPKPFSKRFAEKYLRVGAAAYGTKARLIEKYSFFDAGYTYMKYVQLKGTNVRAYNVKSFLSNSKFWNSFGGKL